jgi:hypothetical protein
VEQGLQELGITGPSLTKTMLIRLGRNLGVDYVAVGRLNDVGGGKNGNTRASLSVLFLDVNTGEWANGANAVGTLASTNADTDTLNRAVLGDAAFTLVNKLNTFQLPQATVLIVRDSTEVTLNGGARNGIRAGQEYVILRGTERVGRVRIRTVNAQDAQAAIIDSGKGIRPEDRARLVVRPNDLP